MSKGERFKGEDRLVYFHLTMANVCAAQASVVLSLLLLIPYSTAVWFTIPRAGTKCLSEEIQHNVVVLGDFMVINSLGTSDNVDNNPNPSPITISVKVTSPYGNTLHHQQNATFGQFAFTTSEAGNYLACFWVDSQHHNEGPEVNLSLDWRTGIAAKDWESVARKEKIEGVELELRKLEAVVETIHENLLFLKQKEGEMREVSERTNWRAAWLSIVSLGLCLAASSLQVWNLKSFFIKKKLI